MANSSPYHEGGVFRVPAAHALYVWIYLFHMPAFIFLAGFFSGARPLLAAVVPAGAGCVAPARADLPQPALARGDLARRRSGAGMLDRVAANFTLSRIIALAPFFVLGALATPERLRMLQRPVARLAGAGVLLTSFTVVAFLHERIGTPIALYWDTSYQSQGLGTLAGFGSRLLLYVVGTALLLAVLAVVPTRRSWLTGIGAASLYVYLLHGFLVRGAISLHVLDHVDSIVVLVVVTTCICLALGSSPVRRLTRPLVEPRLTWLLRRDEAHWSKSSTTSSETGDDWQASTKPDSISSGSRA